MDTTEQQTIINSPDAHWTEAIARLRAEEAWSSIWTIAPLAAPVRCRELTSLLDQVKWKPLEPVDIACLAELIQLGKEWALEEKNTGQCQLSPKMLPCGATVEAFAFSPDGKYVVTSCSEGRDCNEVQLWQFEPWDLVRTFNVEFSPRLLSISPDGRTLAAGSYQNLELWSFPECQSLRTLSPLSKGPTGITFSPYGNYIFACGEEGMIRCWNLDDASFFARFKVPGGSVRRLVCDQTGSFLASFGTGGTVNIWHLPTGNLVHELKAHRESVAGLQFGPDSKVLITVGRDYDLLNPDHWNEDSDLRLWRVSDWTLLHQVPLGVEQLATTGSGNLIAAVFPLPLDTLYLDQTIESLNPKKVSLWDPYSANSIAEFELGEADWSQSVAFSVDGRYLAGIGGTKGICLWPRGFGVSPELAKSLEPLKYLPVSAMSSGNATRLEDLSRTDWIAAPLRGWLRFVAKQVSFSRQNDTERQQSPINHTFKSATPMGTRQCPICKSIMSINARFCVSCGANVVGFAKLCLRQCLACSHYMLDSAKFCSQCGGKVPEQKTKRKNYNQHFKGTCQICGFIVTIDNATGLVTEHEYHSTWSFLNGLCDGSSASPFQESIDLIESVMRNVCAQALSFRQMAKETTESTSSTVQRQTGHGIEPFELNQKNKYIWRYETDHSDITGAIAEYNSRQADPLEKEASLRDAYVLWQTNRLKNWRPSELIPNNAKDRIKAENQAKMLAFRKAKQETIGALPQQRWADTGTVSSSLDNIGDWMMKQIAEGQTKASAVAEKAFLRGDQVISCYIGNRDQVASVRSLKEVAVVLQKWPEQAPLFACVTCNQLYDFKFGELWCQCCEPLAEDEDERKLETMALGLRAFLRGDKLIHVYAYSWTWRDITDINQLHALLDSSECELFCSLCQGQLSFRFGELQCECCPTTPMSNLTNTGDRATAMLHQLRGFGTFRAIRYSQGTMTLDSPLLGDCDDNGE